MIGSKLNARRNDIILSARGCQYGSGWLNVSGYPAITFDVSEGDRIKIWSLIPVKVSGAGANFIGVCNAEWISGSDGMIYIEAYPDGGTAFQVPIVWAICSGGHEVLPRTFERAIAIELNDLTWGSGVDAVEFTNSDWAGDLQHETIPLMFIDEIVAFRSTTDADINSAANESYINKIQCWDGGNNTLWELVNPLIVTSSKYNATPEVGFYWKASDIHQSLFCPVTAELNMTGENNLATTYLYGMIKGRLI